jgi:biotin carboxylase
MVGFGRLLLEVMAGQLPDASVILVEEPDIVRKRNVPEHMARFPSVGQLVQAEYVRRPGWSEAVATTLAGDHVARVVPSLEYAVPGAAELAETLGVPGGGPAARLFCDKIELRRLAERAGLRNPAWSEVRSADDVRAAVARLGTAEVVLKPANRHGSLGVRFLTRSSDVDEAWAFTTAADEVHLLPDRPMDWRYLVEERLHGREVSVECLVSKGEIVFANPTDKLVAEGPYPVELGHVVPGPLATEHLPALLAGMRALVGAAGFDTGVLHGEWIIGDDGPVLVECAARLPGDYIAGLIGRAYGGSFIQEYFTVMAGGSPTIAERPVRAAAIRFLTGSPGTVTRIDGRDEAEAAPGVAVCAVDTAVGRTIGEARSSWDRLGHVIVEGADPGQATERAAAAAALLRIETC